MANPTLAGRLLEAAETLLEGNKRSTAFRRRAISSAYYAVFHAIVKLCADYVTRSAKRNSQEYLRAYRALDHAPLKEAFSRSPLKDSPMLSDLGTAVVTLQAERHRADYLPPQDGLFTYERARELIDIARQAVKQIESIKPSQEECRILALSLLFKERKS
jgi:uncharacterized protein (UPF0332 family)